MARFLPIFLLIMISLTVSSSSATFGRRPSIDSIFNFGDSISDTGNLIRETNGTGPFSFTFNYPYGMSLGSPATGRCSDGHIILDYLAMEFHLPLVSPYLDQKANFSNGVNFAVVGATALDVSFFSREGIFPPFTNSSLGVQLEWFKTYKDSICPNNDCQGIFDRSLFFIGEIGGNDFNHAYFSGKSIDQMNDFVPLVIDQIIQVAQEVIKSGATRLVVPGNFPIGCLPVYLSAADTSDATIRDANGCLKDLNAFAEGFNEQLREALEDLQARTGNATIIYADYYNALMNIVENAHLYGFADDSKLKACCGAGGEYNFKAGSMCGNPGATVCEEPSGRISWDGVHLTQAAYKIIANELVYGGFSQPEGEILDEKKCF